MLRVLKLDHLTGFDVDQVIVVAVLRRLVARPPTPEIPAFQNSLLFKQANGAVDCGDGNPRVQRTGSAIEFLDVRMVTRFRTAPGR